MTAIQSSAAPLAVAPGLGRSWRSPIIYVVATLLTAAVLLGFPGTGTTTFTFAARGSLELPAVTVGAATASGAALVIAALLTLTAVGSRLAGRALPSWVGVLLVLDLTVGLLSWAAAGHTVPVVGLLAGSLALAVPLIFGALGGVLSERVGVVNVAIEGQLLAGAFTSAVVASATHSLLAGLLAAAAAGVLVSGVLALFAIRYLVDQVIIGVVLNVLVLGLTNFLYSAVLVPRTQQLNSPPQLEPVPVPGLSAVPVLGPVLFDQTVIVYLMYAAVAATAYGLYKTKWGLRLRAVGEHPLAADTVGIDVNRTRLVNVCLAGAVAGTGGAYFTLAAVPSFTKDVTSGAGFIALAAVIFGRWNPIRATVAALLFGFVSNLQNVLGIIGSPIPGNLLLMLPYLVAIVAVAGLVGAARGPAASGRPYTKH